MAKKLAVVVGGSRGIGAACVKAFVNDGCYDVAYTSTGDTATSSDGRLYKLDISDAKSVGSVFETLVADYGHAPDVIVLSAGINVPGAPLASFDPNGFRKLIEVNFVGAFNVLAEASRRIADGGAIIALTTSMVRVSIPNAGPYTATKAAVEAMVRSLSRELAGRKVRVNAVAPGPVDTDHFRAGKNDEARAKSAALSPFNRVGEASEIANLVQFIASEKASWITGQVIQPNGGFV